MIRIDAEQYWLYAAADPETSEFPHIRLYPTMRTALTEQFLQELAEKQDVEDTVFLVDNAKHLTAALRRTGLRFQTDRHENRNGIERLFREINVILLV